MSTTISPLRRITVTLALTGAAAFSAVAIAPSAFAADATAPAATDSAAPAVTDPTVVTDPAVVTPPVVVPPAIVLDKNGKPVKAPKYCTQKDLDESAKKVAEATKKAAPLFSLATSSHKAAGLLRAQEIKMTVRQVAAAEAVANGLDMVGDKLAAQAQASIDKAGVLDCFIVAGPDDRF